jgi:hypothetical protein
VPRWSRLPIKLLSAPMGSLSIGMWSSAITARSPFSTSASPMDRMLKPTQRCRGSRASRRSGHSTRMVHSFRPRRPSFIGIRRTSYLCLRPAKRHFNFTSRRCPATSNRPNTCSSHSRMRGERNGGGSGVSSPFRSSATPSNSELLSVCGELCSKCAHGVLNRTNIRRKKRF